MLRAARVLSAIVGGNTVARSRPPAVGAESSLLSGGALAFSATHVSKGEKVDLTRIPPSAFNLQVSDQECAKLTFRNPTKQITETQNGFIIPHPANPECKLFTSSKDGKKICCDHEGKFLYAYTPKTLVEGAKRGTVTLANGGAFMGVVDEHGIPDGEGIVTIGITRYYGIVDRSTLSPINLTALKLPDDVGFSPSEQVDTKDGEVSGNTAKTTKGVLTYKDPQIGVAKSVQGVLVQREGKCTFIGDNKEYVSFSEITEHGIKIDQISTLVLPDDVDFSPSGLVETKKDRNGPVTTSVEGMLSYTDPKSNERKSVSGILTQLENGNTAFIDKTNNKLIVCTQVTESGVKIEDIYTPEHSRIIYDNFKISGELRGVYKKDSTQGKLFLSNDGSFNHIPNHH